MKLDFEYGLGTMQAELPDNTDVFISGETVKDPACIPEDQLEAAYLESLAHPIGMPTLTELAHKGTTVTIIVPDRVKGGEQPTSHRKLSIKYILKELYAAGVEKKDILFIISNGLHPRSKASDAKAIFGDELFNEFWHSGQIISHDSEDQEHMIYLGTTKRGDPVYMNKYVYDSDLPILIGHVQGNPYGGYSGGYKHSATGITNWRCITSHHVPSVMHRDDFTPVNGGSLMRHKFDEISMHMEEKMGHPFFCSATRCITRCLPPKRARRCGRSCKRPFRARSAQTGACGARRWGSWSSAIRRAWRSSMRSSFSTSGMQSAQGSCANGLPGGGCSPLTRSTCLNPGWPRSAIRRWAYWPGARRASRASWRATV